MGKDLFPRWKTIFQFYFIIIEHKYNTLVWYEFHVLNITYTCRYKIEHGKKIFAFLLGLITKIHELYFNLDLKCSWI